MSIDVKDHRKFVEGKLRDADQISKEEKEKRLLEQVDSPLAVTGNDLADKMIRVLEADAQKLEEHMKSVLEKSVQPVPEDQRRMILCEYWFTKGQFECIKKVLQLPAQILAEAKPILH